MKSKIKNGLKLCVTLVSLLTIGLCFCTNVYASENKTNTPLIAVESYSVTNNKIVPGEDFELCVMLKNISPDQTITNIMLDITNPSGVAPVYGSVSQIFVDSIEPGESEQVKINYSSWTSISDEAVDFYMTILANETQNYVTLRIPVGSDLPFSIVSAHVPTKIEKGSYENATVTFKVLGKDNVSNMTMLLKKNGEEIVNSQIGVVTPGATKTHSAPFVLNEVGQYTIEVVLQYEDEGGHKKEVEVGTTHATVSEPINDDTMVYENPEEEIPEQGIDNIALMGISGIIILIIFLAIVLLIRKNK